MPADPKRLITGRILAVEWARRGGEPAAPDWTDELAALPPLSLLAAGAFPIWVLERRLRFWAALGHRPDPGRVMEQLGPPPVPGAGPEDFAAEVYAAEAVRTSDPYLAGLARALGTRCEGPAADPDALDRLEGFLVRWSGPAGGNGPDLAVPPVYGRLEAATAAADRFFGRRGPAPAWDGLSRVVGWAGRVKRRVRP